MIQKNELKFYQINVFTIKLVIFQNTEIGIH